MKAKYHQKQTKRLQVRQGNILLTKLAYEIVELEALNPVRGMHILAEVKPAGNAHRVSAKSAHLLKDSYGMRFLKVFRPTRLLHKEHAPIKLEPGLYELSLQREYTSYGDDTILGD